MDSTGIKVDMTEKGWLEPLVITEEGDVTKGINERGAASNSAAILQSCNKEIALKEKEEHIGTDKNEVDRVAKMCLEHQGPNQQQSHADNQAGEDKQEKDEPGECENMVNGQNRGATERAEQTNEEMRINESLVEPSGTEDENDDNVPQNKPQGNTEELNSSEEQTEGTQSPEEDLKQAHRLTPDFPEALYELLCTLQEGRRLNDQRCSFRLESGVRRRRCHSEPNTTKPANRVIFSSMTSLQTEEFFELVATAQARRLDDQRAQLHRSPLPKSKSRSFRGSIKQLSFVRKPASDPTPAPVPKEDLYNMILTTQAQGRLEDQRSRAPGPMDDEDFFSLLLRVQGGRMDEQRTELPCMLQT